MDPGTVGDTASTANPAPPPAKPDFWRIQNIDIGEKDTATAWLREVVKELHITEGEGYSIAADSEHTLCATLTSFTPPSPPNRRWRVDKDFIGLTPLCDPEEPVVDIVAVTGLGGHAVGSFRSPNGRFVWLRDFAPRDIPQARFITYGYNSTVALSDNNQGVHELARTFLDALKAFRSRTRSKQRPLCFICHSLGGVVLKEALLISSRATAPEHAELQRVIVDTQGLVLLGVPNLGLKHDQLQTVIKGQPNEGFVRDLLVRPDGEPPQFLSYLTNRFSELCGRQQPSWKIVSYYETVHSPTLEVRVPFLIRLIMPCL
jgi:hypothetical protein